jgi:hypothetical protein
VTEGEKFELARFVLKAAGVVAGIAFLYVYWQPINEVLTGLVRWVLLALGVLLGGAFVYQFYDGLRAAVTGIQAKTSAPVKDPTDPKERFWTIFWSLLVLAMLAPFAAMMLGLDMRWFFGK